MSNVQLHNDVSEHEKNTGICSPVVTYSKPAAQ